MIFEAVASSCSLQLRRELKRTRENHALRPVYGRYSQQFLGRPLRSISFSNAIRAVGLTLTRNEDEGISKMQLCNCTENRTTGYIFVCYWIVLKYGVQYQEEKVDVGL